MTDPSTLPLILHVGLHKTATSWLQAHIFDNASDGKLKALKDYKDIIGTIIVPEERDFSATLAQDAFASFISQARHEDKIPVITSEALGGLPFHKRFHRTAYAERLAETFPQAKVLITIREQAAVILSIYGQFIRFGYFSSLKDFLREPPAHTGYQSILEYPYYDYVALLDQYENLFGEGNVVMAPLEVITKTPEWLTDRLSEVSGQTIPAPNISLADKTVNAADAAQTRGVVRQLNRFISRELRWDREHPFLRPNNIGGKLNKIVPTNAAKTAKAKDLKLIREAVGDRYERSNAELAKRLDIDLGALGYAVPSDS